MLLLLCRISQQVGQKTRSGLCCCIIFCNSWIKRVVLSHHSILLMVDRQTETELFCCVSVFYYSWIKRLDQGCVVMSLYYANGG